MASGLGVRYGWMVVGLLLGGLPGQARCAEQSALPQASDKPVALKEGMAYRTFRDRVIAQGWKPKPDAQCKANVVCANFEKVCQHDPAACQVCDDTPELGVCSGDGHCLMQFERSGETMTVSTYGEIRDWSAPDEASRLFVKWWDPGITGESTTRAKD